MAKRIPSMLRAAVPEILISILIVAGIWAVYGQVLDFGFVNYDDGGYVFENRHLQDGFTAEGLRWVFFSLDPDNWFPLTRLSLLADYTFYGLHADVYHAENVVYHTLASLFLFCFLRRATGQRWPSAFVAAVFALHPLHVESVAWITERKDVLCALFWFAALWAWVRYTGRPGWVRYSAALLLFACGLMSKPMIVTFPFLLLLLDIWPLRRTGIRKLLVEKVPFAVLAVATIGLTVAAQRGADAVKPLDLYPMSMRLENAAITTILYIRDTVWPGRLWTAHAWPAALPLGGAIAGAVCILAVSFAAVRQRNLRPWIPVGWFWFLGTLLPVIGLVQVGTQSRADRYMYVPMVGLLIVLTWGAAELIGGRRIARGAAWALSLASLGALAFAAQRQTGIWKDTETLFAHSLACDPGDYVAWEMLGLDRENDPVKTDAAVECFKAALKIRPRSVETHNHLGILLTRLKRYDEAIAVHRESLSIFPRYAAGHYNLGEALLESGRRAEAMDEFRSAIAAYPDFAEAHSELGAELFRNGKADEGIAHLEEAVKIKPDFAMAQYNLGKMLMDRPGRTEEAILHFREALRVSPLNLASHSDLGLVLSRFPERREEAIVHLETAQEISPDPQRGKLLARLVNERVLAQR